MKTFLKLVAALCLFVVAMQIIGGQFDISLGRLGLAVLSIAVLIV